VSAAGQVDWLEGLYHLLLGLLLHLWLLGDLLQLLRLILLFWLGVLSLFGDGIRLIRVEHDGLSSIYVGPY